MAAPVSASFRLIRGVAERVVVTLHNDVACVSTEVLGDNGSAHGDAGSGLGGVDVVDELELGRVAPKAHGKMFGREFGGDAFWKRCQRRCLIPSRVGGIAHSVESINEELNHHKQQVVEKGLRCNNHTFACCGLKPWPCQTQGLAHGFYSAFEARVGEAAVGALAVYAQGCVNMHVGCPIRQ